MFGFIPEMDMAGLSKKSCVQTFSKSNVKKPSSTFNTWTSHFGVFETEY